MNKKIALKLYSKAMHKEFKNYLISKIKNSSIQKQAYFL